MSGNRNVEDTEHSVQSSWGLGRFHSVEEQLSSAVDRNYISLVDRLSRTGQQRLAGRVSLANQGTPLANLQAAEEGVANVLGNDEEPPTTAGLHNGNDGGPQPTAGLHNLTAEQLPPIGAWLVQKGVFLVILLCIFFYHHFTGISVVAVQLVVLGYVNITFQNIIANRAGSHICQIFHMAWLALLMAVTVVLLYYILGDEQVFRSLHFSEPLQGVDGVFNLLWILYINDRVIIFATIGLKMIVTLPPERLLSARRKGRVYALLERGSHIYRWLVASLPWIALLGYYTVLFYMYMFWKALDFFRLAKPVLIACQQAFSNSPHGQTPSRKEVEAVDDSCAICHEIISVPVKLKCKHIFCSECVGRWLEREKTCPLCRTPVVQADTSYRDGTTDLGLQWY